jgi:hypothetical protein
MKEMPTFKGNWVPPYALSKPENDDTKSECVADVDEIAILLAKEGLEIHRAIDVATHIAGMFGRAKPSGWASVENVTEYLDDLRGGADE